MSDARKPETKIVVPIPARDGPLARRPQFAEVSNPGNAACMFFRAAKVASVPFTDSVAAFAWGVKCINIVVHIVAHLLVSYQDAQGASEILFFAGHGLLLL